MTETVVYTHAETQMPPSTLEATAPETAFTATSQTGGRGKKSKAKKKKKVVATSNRTDSNHFVTTPGI